MHIMLWPQKLCFYIGNNDVMDNSLQKIVAASHPIFSSVLVRYGRFTPEAAGCRKDVHLYVAVDPKFLHATIKDCETEDMLSDR